MMLHVVGDHALDEPVGMVVAGVAAQGQGLGGGFGGLGEGVGVELGGQELVVAALVDQDRGRVGVAGAQQQGGVVARPRRRGPARGSARRPSGPRGPPRGCRSGARAETARQRAGSRSARVRAPWPPMEWPVMPRRSGRMGKVGFGQGRKLVGDEAVHAVVGGPGGLGGVEAEAGAGAEIPVGVLARECRRHAGWCRGTPWPGGARRRSAGCRTWWRRWSRRR